MGAVAVRLGMSDVDAVGRGILTDDQQFLDAGIDKSLGFADHRMRRARHEPSAHIRNDAKLALVIAAFGNLQIAVVTRGQ